MRLGIDTFGCDHARSGIGSYLRAFTANIKQGLPHTAELFGSEIDKFTYTSGTEIPFKSASIPDSLSAERFWHFTACNKFAAAQGYDAVLYPAPDRVLPVSFKVPGVAVVNTVLSSSVEGNPDWIQKLQIKRGLYKVQRIIAASEFIREDLVKHGVPAEKIEVVYNGIDHKIFYPVIHLDAEVVNVKPFAIKRPYFIYASRLSSPEKKHIELIKAFSLFKERTGLPHRLVLAGAEGAYSSEIHKAAFESSAASDIFLTGYFPHENFPALYAGAAACIFPSVNEGVALPVLEAMAVGVPVLCSSAGAIPEMGRDAALYFNSDNIEEIESAMEKIVSDKELRASMSQKGMERAAAFSWETTVKKTFETLSRVIS
ncbi:MAG: glycosyltransferase family 4 protein [Treponema sp.]